MKKQIIYVFGTILLGAVLGAGIFFLTNPRQAKFQSKVKPSDGIGSAMPTSAPIASLSASASAAVKVIGPSPQDITQNYYNAYQNCLKNPPATAAGQVSQYCLQNNQYVSNDFSKNMAGRLGAAAGIDPVLCSQNPPQSVRIDRQTITDDTASTYAIPSFGGEPEKQILVHLVSDSGSWKISDIICPR